VHEIPTSSPPSTAWAGFRRLVALGAITAMAQTGCSQSPIHFVLPELRDRSRQIERIAVVTVGVSVRREGSHDFPREWAETARTNLSNAIAKSFGKDTRFAITELEPSEAQVLGQELERARDRMAAVRPRRIEARDCLAGPAPALANAAGTDALLLVYAKDSIGSASSRLTNLGAAVMVAPIVLWGTIVYGPEIFSDDPDQRVSSMRAIALCLVDARQGDILWFDLRPLNGGHLLDASDVDRRIGDAYAEFREAVQR
jgi:hypothetical protein